MSMKQRRLIACVACVAKMQSARTRSRQEAGCEQAAALKRSVSNPGRLTFYPTFSIAVRNEPYEKYVPQRKPAQFHKLPVVLNCARFPGIQWRDVVDQESKAIPITSVEIPRPRTFTNVAPDPHAPFRPSRSTHMQLASFQRLRCSSEGMRAARWDRAINSPACPARYVITLMSCVLGTIFSPVSVYGAP